MARTRTRQELRDAIRVRADIVGSKHPTDANLNEMINGSGAALHALCVEACEDDFAATASITTAAGTATYGVTLYKIRSVHFTGSSGYARALPRFTLEELARYTTPTAQGEPEAYRMVGGKIMFAPTPQGVFAVTLYGVASFADLSTDGSTLDGRDGWEEWVIWDCTVKCNILEETDPRAAMQERAAVEARILKQMRTLDQAKPHRVTDVADPLGYTPWWW